MYSVFKYTKPEISVGYANRRTHSKQLDTEIWMLRKRCTWPEIAQPDRVHTAKFKLPATKSEYHTKGKLQKWWTGAVLSLSCLSLSLLSPSLSFTPSLLPSLHSINFSLLGAVEICKHECLDLGRSGKIARKMAQLGKFRTCKSKVPIFNSWHHLCWMIL